MTEATGDDLTFQWQKNSSNLKCGRNYSGTDTNTLKIQQVKRTDAGCYRCLVKNEVKLEGEISEEAELNVCECLSMWLVIYHNSFCLSNVDTFSILHLKISMSILFLNS